MVRGNAVYESQYLLCTSIVRPLIARPKLILPVNLMLMRWPMEPQVRNDQCRFEPTFSALAPELLFSPMERRFFPSALSRRREMIEYCQSHNIEVEASSSKPYSTDRNLWHISYEAGILEDPWFDPTTPETA